MPGKDVAMISIRKYLDASLSNADAPMPGAEEGLAGRAIASSRDPVAAFLDAYRRMLSGVGQAGMEACPALGNALEANLAAIGQSLSTSPSGEAIGLAGEKATTEIRNWGRSTARHYRQKAAEVKEMLLAMARAAESVGERDQRCARKLHEVTANLRSIASLDDLSQIRFSIEKSASELKGSIDRMTAEGKEVLGRLQSQVKTFEVKLAEAEQLASVDALTRLRSRSWMENQVEQRIAAAAPFCVALLDLDGFKRVNDDYGHVVGDEVLRQFAAELKSVCRSTDLVGRWGGDEFLILLDYEIEAARAQMDRVREWVCGAYTIQRKGGPVVLRMGATIGLAAFTRRETMTQLIDRADAAMYAGKSEARRKA
ncbi:GGDEF domain-containing protein [Acidobacteria bacterium AB60]|nr:GGDEF domain-containing protein [Acidobacteria bacterium AB60]